MRKVLLFSVLLILGLAGSQVLPAVAGNDLSLWQKIIQSLTMVALAFIMIHVGYEFEIDKSRPEDYGWDYVVAMTAAAFPWVLATGYFLVVMLGPDKLSSWQAWKETLLAGRFAAPTSAGVLFAMLAAAGLGATWTFRKARVLAIFDDLDTVLLMVPLKMLMIGLAWQLGFIVLIMVAMLVAAWRWLHRLAIPVSWPWVLGYAAIIAAVSEVLYVVSKSLDEGVPIHLEVLLPAFVLGCLMRRPMGVDVHADDALPAHEIGPDTPREQAVATTISAVFMVLVGLSMPQIVLGATAAPQEAAEAAQTVSAAQPSPGYATLALHVLALTVLSNLGKMFPAFCYRRQAHRRERLAVAVGMWPRGEVGAGVLVVSLTYNIGGPIVTVAILSLALNLVLTGPFIVLVRRLLNGLPDQRKKMNVMTTNNGSRMNRL